MFRKKRQREPEYPYYSGMPVPNVPKVASKPKEPRLSSAFLTNTNDINRELEEIGNFMRAFTIELPNILELDNDKIIELLPNPGYTWSNALLGCKKVTVEGSAGKRTLPLSEYYQEGIGRLLIKLLHDDKAKTASVQYRPHGYVKTGMIDDLDEECFTELTLRRVVDTTNFVNDATTFNLLVEQQRARLKDPYTFHAKDITAVVY